MPFIMPLLLSAYLDDPGALAIATLMATAGHALISSS